MDLVGMQVRMQFLSGIQQPFDSVSFIPKLSNCRIGCRWVTAESYWVAFLSSILSVTHKLIGQSETKVQCNFKLLFNNDVRVESTQKHRKNSEVVDIRDWASLEIYAFHFVETRRRRLANCSM